MVVFFNCLLLLITAMLIITTHILLYFKVANNLEGLKYILSRILIFVAGYLCYFSSISQEKFHWRSRLASILAIIYSLLVIICSKFNKFFSILENIEGSSNLFPFKQRLLIFLKSINQVN